MPKPPRIYTRSGDNGETGLGDGARVKKTALRVEAFGAVDELNAALGMARACGVDRGLDEILGRLQNELFALGARLCTPGAGEGKESSPRIDDEQVRLLEADIDRISGGLPALRQFILPGGEAPAALLHFARTVARRVERAALRLHEREPVDQPTRVYLNRLSDLLFVMAREANNNGAADVVWKPAGEPGARTENHGSRE